MRLCERPLDERTAAFDTPGRQESVRVQPLGPFHGRVLDATLQPVGTDFGDIVLFREIAGERVHLSTLLRRGWQLVDFLAVGPEALPQLTGARLLSQREQQHPFCATCWQTATAGDPPSRHRHKLQHCRVLRGRLALAPGRSWAELELPLSVVAPEAHALAGREGRTAIDRRRAQLLR